MSTSYLNAAHAVQLAFLGAAFEMMVIRSLPAVRPTRLNEQSGIFMEAIVYLDNNF